MNRTLKLSIMLALAAGGGHAMAQNLGPAQVRSTIDQPLLAEIPITGVTGGAGDIHVTLASAEAFSRAGLNRDGLPVALSFAVAKGASGQPVVRVTSSEPIRDTYLDFLVEVSAGGNKVVREVTMLLDPPGSTPSAPGANVAAGPRPSRTSEVPARVSQATQPSRAESTAPAAPVAAPSRAEAPAPRTHAAPRAQATSSASASQVGPVKRGETLSAIARDHADGADINQMLVALQKANPDAFYRDNINALKTGAVLRIPSADDVKAQSAAAALTEVRRQNEAWRSGTARSPAVVADAASTGAAQGKARPSAGDDRLALVPAKEGGEAASTRAGSKNGTGDAQVAGLKQELATSQESVASLRQQGEELKSRVADLEAIKTKNERLISLKDSEIAELQRKLAEAGKAPVAAAAPASAPAPAAPAASASAPAPVAAASAPAAPKAASTAGEPTAATVTTTPLKAPAAVPPQAVKPRPAPAPIEEETPWFMQPWAWGAGGVVVLLLLLALFARRKKTVAAPAAAPLATPSLADRFGDEPRFDGFDGIDPDQREILDALAEHPDDIGLHLELVSLYYGRGDVDHFEAAAEAMYAHISDPDQPEWRDVVAMGQELAPTHPLFGGVPGDTDDDEYASDTYTASTPHDAHEAAALEEFDLGHYVTSPEDDERVAPAPQKHSEYHFNFDLTPVQRAEAETRPNAPDVFDVDAPASPYVEPHETHAPAFGDVLAEETTLPEERQTWSFDDVPETPVHPIRAESHRDVPTFDEPPRFDEPHFPDEEPVTLDASPEGFSDDPVDTKLDLARAYLDMGDAEGARLMLEEVMAEGSQMQKDTAKRILDDIA
ncbi:FimV/HubP family polar landmark protein [Luteibacter sp. CQ10]|uniref:FimV/HubP family polar landmark protein n=1 Tax=Luteibacter sp. CQ10 TaxID=2805821 RepID=UPI0034A1BD42